MYVLWRLDQGKGWVAPAGSKKSYTGMLQNARVYGTREEAAADACENEQVQTVEWAMGMRR